ncbi:MAG: CDC27 family protein [Bacillota bacterium]|nr:CDC27 family protein [Bacillota bacterium]
MDIWSVLEIPPTNDISIIKKAYAAKLKKCHPEDDPQGYQQLREAFDKAVKLSKRTRSSGLKHDDSTVNIENNIDSIDLPESSEEMNLNNSKSDFKDEQISNNKFKIPPHIRFNNQFTRNNRSLYDDNKELIKKAKELYNVFSARIDETKWETLFDCESMWNLYNKELVNAEMINFISEHYHLPKKVWQLLDSNFNWSTNIDFLNDRLPNKLVKYIIRRINEPQSLDFSYLKDLDLDTVALDNYIEFREAAFDDLLKKNYNGAFVNLTQAEEIYPEDPELWRMKGEYYYLMGNAENSLELLNKYLNINQFHTQSLFFRSNLLYKNKAFNKAIEDLNKVLLKNNNHIEALDLISKCNIQIENFQEAQKYISKAIELSPSKSSLQITLLDSIKCKKKKILSEIRQNSKDKLLRSKLKQVNSELKSFYKCNKSLKPNSKFKKKLIIRLILTSVILTIGFGIYSIVSNSNKEYDSQSYEYETYNSSPNNEYKYSTPSNHYYSYNSDYSSTNLVTTGRLVRIVISIAILFFILKKRSYK